MWQKSGRVQDLDFDDGGSGGFAAALDEPIIRSEQKIAGGGFCRDDVWMLLGWLGTRPGRALLLGQLREAGALGRTESPRSLLFFAFFAAGSGFEGAVGAGVRPGFC